MTKPQQNTDRPQVTIRKSNALATKLGLQPGQKLTIDPKTIEQMTQAAKRKTTALSSEFQNELLKLRHLVRDSATGWKEAVYNKAHDVRGLAATFDAAAAGIFAGQLCRYFESLPSSESAEAEIVKSHVEAMVNAADMGDTLTDTAKSVLAALEKLVETHIAALGSE